MCLILILHSNRRQRWKLLILILAAINWSDSWNVATFTKQNECVSQGWGWMGWWLISLKTCPWRPGKDSPVETQTCSKHWDPAPWPSALAEEQNTNAACPLAGSSHAGTDGERLSSGFVAWKRKMDLTMASVRHPHDEQGGLFFYLGFFIFITGTTPNDYEVLCQVSGANKMEFNLLSC